MRFKTIFKTALYIVGLSVLIYIEDHHRGVMMIIAIIVYFAAMWLVYLSDGYYGHLKHVVRFAVAAFICGFVLSLFVGVHVRKNADSVEIVSPFYTHSLGIFDSIDTLSLFTSYEVYYNSYTPYRQELYLVHHHDSCDVWNKYRRLLTSKGNITFKKKDLGHGQLDVAKCSDGKESYLYDLYFGKRIGEDYRPHLIDRTPPDITY